MMDMLFKSSHEDRWDSYYDGPPPTTTDDIINAIESVLPKRRPIEHHEPFINKKKATVEIANCLARGTGKYHSVELFEDWLKNFTGVEYTLCTNTGTAALHLALLAAGVKYGDEVICPVSTFVATSNAISYCGATPHFIDGAPTIDPTHLKEYLEKITKPIQGGMGRMHRDGRKITAIIIVHLLGIPADMEKICEVAKEMNLIIVEDASQALGTRINGKHVGTFGWAGVFSFNNNKILTTNGGGAVITNSPNIWFDAKQLSSTARKQHEWLIEHESLAFNYRMPNICAALGLSQAQEFRRIQAEKQGLALRYRKALKGLVKFVEPTIPCEPNNWLTAIQVDNRDELLEALHNKGIKARASFSPLHTLNFYKYSAGPNYSYQYNICTDDMKRSIDFFNRTVCLPSGAGL